MIKELEDYRRFTGPAELHKAINTLVGLLSGVAIDRSVNESEFMEVQNWVELYRPIMDRHPFSEIIPVIDQALSDGVLSVDETDDILWLCRNLLGEDSFSAYYDVVTSSIQQLEGIIHGLVADNTITDYEIQQFQDWMDAHTFLAGTYPFDEVYSLLSSVLADQVVTDDERNTLKSFFYTFIDTKESFNVNEPDVMALQEQYTIGGICAVSPSITIPGKTFCFTGTSARAKRKEIAAIIEEAGGLYQDTITKAIDYLIVGAEGNPCWAFSCYGRKVEKAIQLRKAGRPIVLVNEHDFWAALS